MDKGNNGEKVAWALVQAATTAKVIGGYAETLSHLSDAITTSNDKTSEVAAVFIGADPRSLDLDENKRPVMQAAFYAYMTTLATQVRVAKGQIARNLADVERTHNMLEEVIAANRPVCSWCGGDADAMYDTSDGNPFDDDEDATYLAETRFMCTVHAQCSEADCDLIGFVETPDPDATSGPGVRLLCCNHTRAHARPRVFLVKLLDMGHWTHFNAAIGEFEY